MTAKRRRKRKSRKKNKVEPVSVTKVDWTRRDYERPSWMKDMLKPKIPVKEYALVLTMYWADGPVKWRDVVDTIEAHYTRVNPSMRKLQEKDYKRKITPPGEEPKLYRITRKGRKIIFNKPEIWKTVKNNRMSWEHAWMMIKQWQIQSYPRSPCQARLSLPWERPSRSPYNSCNQERDWIGVKKNPEYVKMVEKRLNANYRKLDEFCTGRPAFGGGGGNGK